MIFCSLCEELFVTIFALVLPQLHVLPFPVVDQSGGGGEGQPAVGAQVISSLAMNCRLVDIPRLQPREALRAVATREGLVPAFKAHTYVTHTRSFTNTSRQTTPTIPYLLYMLTSVVPLVNSQVLFGDVCLVALPAHVGLLPSMSSGMHVQVLLRLEATLATVEGAREVVVVLQLQDNINQNV